VARIHGLGVRIADLKTHPAGCIVQGLEVDPELVNVAPGWPGNGGRADPAGDADHGSARSIKPQRGSLTSWSLAAQPLVQFP
jgi:hypothetical protein